MTIKPALYAAALLQLLAVQLVIAIDDVTGGRGATVGAAALIGVVATAAGGLLLKNVQANKQLFAQAMEQLAAEQASHANTRARLDNVERELLALALAELGREDLAQDQDLLSGHLERLGHHVDHLERDALATHQQTVDGRL